MNHFPKPGPVVRTITVNREALSADNVGLVHPVILHTAAKDNHMPAEHMNPGETPGPRPIVVESVYHDGKGGVHQIKDAGPMRQSAAGLLRAKAEQHRGRAARLDELAKLADSLPPGSPAEEALWAELMSPSPWPR